MGSHQSTEAGGSRLSPVEVVDGAARLVAGRCRDCATPHFPLRERCPSCGGGVERILLPSRGTLWTWTTQGFEPKPPYVPDGDAFAPYGVGYAEFAGLLRVEGRITQVDGLSIDMPVEVVAVERAGRTTYAFAPVSE